MFAVTLLLLYGEDRGIPRGHRHLMSCFLCCLLSLVVLHIIMIMMMMMIILYMLFFRSSDIYILQKEGCPLLPLPQQASYLQLPLSLSLFHLLLPACFLSFIVYRTFCLFITLRGNGKGEALDCVVISLFNVFITRTLTRS